LSENELFNLEAKILTPINKQHQQVNSRVELERPNGGLASLSEILNANTEKSKVESLIFRVVNRGGERAPIV
jgi:hypothetical protein